MEPTLHNPARERLEAGELALGVGIRQSRTVDIAAIMKACGYDWLFLDLEHNSMDLDTAVQISVARLASGSRRSSGFRPASSGSPHGFSTAARSAS
jgi:2-keto-3-deoxy-L-rhamnonate aldolase RhmA